MNKAFNVKGNKKPYSIWNIWLGLKSIKVQNYKSPLTTILCLNKRHKDEYMFDILASQMLAIYKFPCRNVLGDLHLINIKHSNLNRLINILD